MQKEHLNLDRHHWDMQRVRSLIAGMCRTIADNIENRDKNNDVDLMADVDDQRAHHFGTPEDFDESDDSP